MCITANELVEQYVPLAKKLAYQKKRVLPKFIDVEDLESAAYLGLVEAANRFKTDHGVTFSTFAYPRIFGAIHDWLREQGWGKRGEPLKVISLDSTLDESDDCQLKDTIAAKEEGNHEEMLEVIACELDEQAKDVLRYYFVDEFSMKEIGDRFGVSESRISQLIKRYKERIRADWDRTELYSVLAA